MIALKKKKKKRIPIVRFSRIKNEPSASWEDRILKKYFTNGENIFLLYLLQTTVNNRSTLRNSASNSF